MKVQQIANILTFFGIIIVNALANALPINGYTTGELSDMYPNLFVPAGLTFSVWAVIYLLLAGFLVSQSVSLFGKEETPGFVRRIGWLFVLNGAANASWILLWHHKMPAAAMAVMVCILLSLITIYQRLGVGQRIVSRRELWTAHIPFAVYLGWICIATIANMTTVLTDAGWNGNPLSEPAWTVIMITTGTILAGLILRRRGDAAFGLVTAWALLGIYLKRTNAEPVIPAVAYTALLFTVLLTLWSGWLIFRALQMKTN